jgi:hypothetical protein
MDTKVKNGDVTVVKNDDGTYETVYPDVLDVQMDLFLTRTKADFDKYKGAGQIASLYNHMTGLYRNFDKIIATNLLKNGDTYWHERYGVPVNHVIGEYSFLVVDKDGGVDLLNVGMKPSSDPVEQLSELVDRAPELIAKIKDAFRKTPEDAE